MVQAGEGRTYCRTCAGMMRNCRQPASVPPILDAPPARRTCPGNVSRGFPDTSLPPLPPFPQSAPCGHGHEKSSVFSCLDEKTKPFPFAFHVTSVTASP